MDPRNKHALLEVRSAVPRDPLEVVRVELGHRLAHVAPCTGGNLEIDQRHTAHPALFGLWRHAAKRDDLRIALLEDVERRQRANDLHRLAAHGDHAQRSYGG